MCESFERLANKVAEERAEQRAEQAAVQTKASIVKTLMENMEWTLDQALTASGIQGKERGVIAKLMQRTI